MVSLALSVAALSVASRAPLTGQRQPLPCFWYVEVTAGVSGAKFAHETFESYNLNMSEKLTPVVVTMDPKSLGKTSVTADQLKQAGLRDVSVLEALGIITGNIAEEDLVVLKSWPDITVERDEPIQIPEPGSPLM